MEFRVVITGSGAAGAPGALAVNLVEGDQGQDPANATVQLHLRGANSARGQAWMASIAMTVLV